jgi:nucleoside-diphosphate-sugar epimerase
MEAPKEQVKIRSSYNLSAISFTPKQLAEAIKVEIPSFDIVYNPDFRQAIADSWPASIDDREARANWNWKERYDLNKMVKIMLENVDLSLLKN